jgi:hypothetical protein
MTENLGNLFLFLMNIYIFERRRQSAEEPKRRLPIQHVSGLTKKKKKVSRIGRGAAESTF